jgi:hypothetical protein
LSIQPEMKNMYVMKFWFIPGARESEKKLEKSNSVSMWKFRSVVIHSIWKTQIL